MAMPQATTDTRTAETSTAVVLDDKPRLGWDEICARYPRQWVLLVGMDWIEGDPAYRFRSAVVLARSLRRGDALRACSPGAAGYGQFAHLYTGPMRRWCPLEVPSERAEPA